MIPRMGANAKVEVYTKKDCTLCGPVLKTVQKVKKDFDFDLVTIDIGDDAELLAKHGHEVPVVFIDGRKAFKGRLTEQAFKKRLKKTRSRVAESKTAEVSSLDMLQAETPRPPSALVFALAFAGLLTCTYFVWQGVSSAELGRGRIAAQLFRVTKPKAKRAVSFELESMRGGKKSLNDYSGKVLFVNFWATWCPPCIKEMPSMKKFYSRYKDDPRFAFVAISTDDDWTPVRKMAAKDGLPFDVLLDPSGTLAKEYGTDKFPETYVIVDGEIVGHIVADRDWETWYASAYAEELLRHKKALGTEHLAQTN